MQLVEHAVDGHLVELALIEGVDVVVGDVGEDVVEQPRLLVDRTDRLGLTLEEPATGGERDDGDGDDHQSLATHHETPRSESQAASRTAFFD